MTCRTPDPSGLMTHTLARSFLPQLKAMSLPSGEQAGLKAASQSAVSGFWPVPSARMT